MATNNDTIHSLFVWEINREGITQKEYDKRCSFAAIINNKGHSINDLIRAVRKVEKWNDPIVEVEAEVQTSDLLKAQHNDGIYLASDASNVLQDLLIIRKMFR